MINTDDFYSALISRGVRLFTGVPDSLLKNLCSCLQDNASCISGIGDLYPLRRHSGANSQDGQCSESDAPKHLIAANEGNALAIAAGHYLATGAPAVVYMQNSGLGNALNPLVSLTDREVYSIPSLLIIGWRGEPGLHDEPQHIKQGRITRQLLEVLEIPCQVLSADSDWKNALDDAFGHIQQQGTPAALLIKKGTFSQYCSSSSAPAVKAPPTEKSASIIRDIHSVPGLKRERALEILLEHLSDRDIIVSTTGKTSRELFEIRRRRGESARDFLTVGSMGHSSSIAFGISMARPNQRVICLDGDGAMLMHLGAMSIIGCSGLCGRFLHILLNNGAHESVGGQPTVADNIDWKSLSKACGYSRYYCACNEGELGDILRMLNGLSTEGAGLCNAESDGSGPVLLEIKLRTGSRPDLGRPDSTPIENRRLFMEHLKKARM